MRHFMTYTNAYTSIVHRIICFKIKERELENAGRKKNFVSAGIITCINGWRGEAAKSFYRSAYLDGSHFLHKANFESLSLLPI
jgi:hypothetical protein